MTCGAPAAAIAWRTDILLSLTVGEAWLAQVLSTSANTLAPPSSSIGLHGAQVKSNYAWHTQKSVLEDF
jgi:hypothetical protein